MNDPTHIDICSGIGGFSIAAAWAGFRTTTFCEIDRYCQEVLKARFGAVAIFDSRKRSQQLFNGRTWWQQEFPALYPDLRQLDGRYFRGASLLTGGIPCQPASCAGKRRGAKDDRWLWPAALRFLGEALPTFAVFENPPGLLALEGGLVFESLLVEMERCGYEVAPPLVIPALAVGADYYRARVFVVAHLNQFRLGRWSEQQGITQGEGCGRNKTAGHSSQPLGARLAQREVEHNRQCQAAFGSGGPIFPETHLELLRGLPRVPTRVDRNRRARIHALGNSVVPAQAYPILKAIREAL